MICGTDARYRDEVADSSKRPEPPVFRGCTCGSREKALGDAAHRPDGVFDRENQCGASLVDLLTRLGPR